MNSLKGLYRPAKTAYRSVRRAIRSGIPWLTQPPLPGRAALCKWRSVQPIRRNFGWDSGGMCVDRYYIEDFLERHKDAIQGRVLEVAEDTYTKRFGGERVTRADVLHVIEGSPNATIIGNLVTGSGLPDSSFDCIILTQVMLCTFDLRAVVKTIHRILAPGGVVLVTNPGISQIARYDMDQWGDCWRFTSCSSNRLFTEMFPQDHVAVETRGNVLIAIALLHGLLATELTAAELSHDDPDYQVCVFVRATKPGSEPGPAA